LLKYTLFVSMSQISTGSPTKQQNFIRPHLVSSISTWFLQNPNPFGFASTGGSGSSMNNSLTSVIFGIYSVLQCYLDFMNRSDLDFSSPHSLIQFCIAAGRSADNSQLSVWWTWLSLHPGSSKAVIRFPSTFWQWWPIPLTRYSIW